MRSIKVSIDGGGLCLSEEDQFGNYTFSKNLINALSIFDKKNHYFLYTFCEKEKDLKLGKNIAFKKLYPRLFWSKIRVSIEECFKKKDFYLGLNQSIPMMTFSKVISFSHGLSFRFYQGFYRNFDKLNDQLESLVKDSDKIVVSSVRVKREMIELYPKIKDRINVIPFGIPLDMPITSARRKREKYFLHVAMDHPIKNVDFIIKAFNKIRKTRKYKDYRLYLIGYKGEINDPKIKTVSHVTRTELRKLYQRATALLTASHYESFNFPVLEALSQGTQAIGLREAIIPELRPFTRLADDMEEFVELMKKAASRPFKIKRDIAEVFSWKKYVKELLKLYN